MNRVTIVALIKRVAKELDKPEAVDRVRYVISHSVIKPRFGVNNVVTKHVIVVDGRAQEIIECKGFHWKNISRITMHQIMREVIKSL